MERGSGLSTRRGKADVGGAATESDSASVLGGGLLGRETAAERETGSRVGAAVEDGVAMIDKQPRGTSAAQDLN